MLPYFDQYMHMQLYFIYFRCDRSNSYIILGYLLTRKPNCINSKVSCGPEDQTVDPKTKLWTRRPVCITVNTQVCTFTTLLISRWMICTYLIKLVTPFPHKNYKTFLLYPYTKLCTDNILCIIKYESCCLLSNLIHINITYTSINHINLSIHQNFQNKIYNTNHI